MSQVFHVGAPFKALFNCSVYILSIIYLIWKNWIVDYFTTFTGEKTPQNNFFQHSIFWCQILGNPPPPLLLKIWRNLWTPPFQNAFALMMIIKLKGVIYYPENALQSTRNTVFADKHMKEIQMWTLVQVNFVQCNINPIYYVINRMLYIWNIFSALI